LADFGFADGILPGSVSLKQSLGNTLRLIRPVVVVDEGHKAYSDTARDTLAGFNPRFILELSATPNTGGKQQSNVLVNVPGADLKDEQMIKLPINVINEAKGGWKHTLTLAHAKIDELQKDADALRAVDGRYIRPILLVRVERTGKDQRDSAFVHAEDAREYLRDKLGAKEEEIRLKTSDNDELGDDDLLAESSKVRYIITKDALREGWDCPFAYVLAILSRTTANTALTQMIGRVLRQPHARLTGRQLLDECYVFTFDQDVNDAVNGVRKGLEDEGMADLASSVRAMDGSGTTAQKTRREIIKRRAAFAKLPPIFLPRVLHREDGHHKAGGAGSDSWRPLDYERDIIGQLDWDDFHFLHPDASMAVDAEQVRRTVARINLDRKSLDGQTVIDLEQQVTGGVPEEGLDIPFLVRQLLDAVPNPWQAMRLLSEALATLRENEVSEERIFANRLDLVQAIKQEIARKAAAAGETLFREKLNNGTIALKLAASNDPKLNWQLAELLEVEVTDVDQQLYRKSGGPLEKNLFEKVYARDLNTLERNTAWYLDESDAVYWWHRIAVGRGSYGLQGWQKNKVYPDLLACVHGMKGGKFRFSVLETKGDHLKNNDDTEYKRKLFDLLTLNAKVGETVGELQLEVENAPIRFRMLMEEDWKAVLMTEGV
jgi:type III restriction enzyme